MRPFLFLLLSCCSLSSHAQLFVGTWAGTGTAGYHDTLRTEALFRKPWGLHADASGNAYVVDGDNHCLRRIDRNTGIVTTLAGTGVAGFADGSANIAQFNYPTDCWVDANRNVWIADFENQAIRKVDPLGNTTTVCGYLQGLTNGSLNIAQFRFPRGIVMDKIGNIYVADSWNHCIRMIDTTAGVVSTFAGGGTVQGVGSIGSWVDGQDTSARFYTPCGLAIDSLGVIYVADAYNHRIRKIETTAEVRTLAGSGPSGSATGSYLNASLDSARFNTPTEVWTNTLGTEFLVADTYNQRIRSILAASNSVTTFAGDGQAGYVNGPAANAQFNFPRSITRSLTDYLVTDWNNHTVRILTNDSISAFANPTFQRKEMNVWPVPFTTEVHVSFPAQAETYLLRMIDLTGRQVIPPRYVTLADGEMTLPTSDIPAGVYLLTAENDKGIQAWSRITKQ